MTVDALARRGLRSCNLTRPKLHAAMRALRLRIAGMDIDFTGGSATGGRFVELVQVAEGGRFLR